MPKGETFYNRKVSKRELENLGSWWQNKRGKDSSPDARSGSSFVPTKEPAKEPDPVQRGRGLLLGNTSSGGRRYYRSPQPVDSCTNTLSDSPPISHRSRRRRQDESQGVGRSEASPFDNSNLADRVKRRHNKDTRPAEFIRHSSSTSPPRLLRRRRDCTRTVAFVECSVEDDEGDDEDRDGGSECDVEIIAEFSDRLAAAKEPLNTSTYAGRQSRTPTYAEGHSNTSAHAQQLLDTSIQEDSDIQEQEQRFHGGGPARISLGFDMAPSLDRGAIVQEYRHPGHDTVQHSYNIYKSLSENEKARILMRAAEEAGVEKPQGYNVSFHYNPRVEQHHFGSNHPMKPWRLQLTKQLVLAYGLQFAMDNFVTLPATREQLAAFHFDDYLDFLSKVTPSNMDNYIHERDRYDIASTNPARAGGDCPVFDGMWDYCLKYSGATIDAARNLISEQSHIAINWSGGLHHAKKRMASGFCYINDIVLAIQMLLRHHARVLYIDIDIHHGDGVEEAFFSSDRVMTLSFHKYDGQFFPGTGDLTDNGPKTLQNPGAHYSMNVPLRDGIDDAQYARIFREVTARVIDAYDPKAIVLQCGADSLGGDRLGQFNLNIKAHGECVEFVKKRCHDRPLLIVGGGGYTPRNVARTWCHETALCVDIPELPNTIPGHVPYRQAFQSEHKGGGKLYPDLAWGPNRHKNDNDEMHIHKVIEHIAEELRYLQGAPSVMMDHIPGSYLQLRAEVDARMAEEDEERDRERAETNRRTRERNTGGRGELR